MDYRQLKPEQFSGEIYRGARECHTRKRFVARAMNYSFVAGSRGKSPAARPRSKVAVGTAWYYWPGTFLLNRSNVKRKPAARGRTRQA